MFRTYKSLVWMVAALLLLAAPVLAQDAPTPAVEVSDQAIENGTVTVDRVVSNGPGWITIHADNNGAPGAVLGYSAVVDGENADVTVEIDEEGATGTLYAMLHTDLGVAGTYEFPGADVPVQVNGQVLSVAFTVTAMEGAQETPMAMAEATATAGMTATTGTDMPAQLPETGGSAIPWTPFVLAGLGTVLLVAGSLAAMRRTADIKIEE